MAGGTDGHIRLFTKGSSESDGASPWKRPKTDISQLADPVTGLDVSRDGSYIVWTTKKYIAVISAEFKDADGNVASGFEVFAFSFNVSGILIIFNRNLWEHTR